MSILFTDFINNFIRNNDRETIFILIGNICNLHNILRRFFMPSFSLGWAFYVVLLVYINKKCGYRFLLLILTIIYILRFLYLIVFWNALFSRVLYIVLLLLTYYVNYSLHNWMLCLSFWLNWRNHWYDYVCYIFYIFWKFTIIG